MSHLVSMSRGGSSDLSSHWATTSAVEYTRKSIAGRSPTPPAPVRTLTGQAINSRDSIAFGSALPEDFDTSYSTTFRRPPVPTGNEPLPASVVLDESGFRRNHPVTNRHPPSQEQRALHPLVLSRLQKADPIGAENNGSGPSLHSTTSLTAHTGATTLYGADACVTVGARTLSGYAVNARAFLPPPPRPPPSAIDEGVPEALIYKAASTRRLEYEGNVYGSIAATSYTDPRRQPRPGTAPMERSRRSSGRGEEPSEAVTCVESSSFGRSTSILPPFENPRDGTAFAGASHMHPKVAARIRSRDPTEHHNLVAGPAHLSTSTLFYRPYGREERYGPAGIVPSEISPFVATAASVQNLQAKGLAVDESGVSVGPRGREGRRYGGTAAPFDKDAEWVGDTAQRTSRYGVSRQDTRGMEETYPGVVEDSSFSRSMRLDLAEGGRGVLDADARFQSTLLSRAATSQRDTNLGSLALNPHLSLQEKKEASEARLCADRSHSHKARR